MPTPEGNQVTAQARTGTCAVCDREYRLTKSGKVWTHNNAIRDTQSGSYGMRCSGAGQPPKEQ
jgi:hypothetical protein